MADAQLYAPNAAPGAKPIDRAESGRWRATILTPEGVELRVEIAERGERAGAFLIDLLFVGAAVVAIIIATIYLFQVLSAYALAVGLIAFFLVRTFYFLFFELVWRGRTPGKRLINLRVIDRVGGPLRPSAVVVRNLVRELEVFLPVSLMLIPADYGDAALIRLLMGIWVAIFVLMPLFNRQGLRVGDMVAGTFVVALPKAVLLPDLVDKTAASRGSVAIAYSGAAGRDYNFTPAQLGHYGIYELQTLEAVLRRTDEHAPATRREIAERVRKKIGWKDEAGEWDLKYDSMVLEFLQAFYVAQRAHLERKMLFGKRRRDKHDKA